MSNLQDPRVLLALERTVLAWNRSSLALIAFGFVIEKSAFIAQLVDPVKYADKIAFSKWVGIGVIVLGMIVCLISMQQYRIALRSITDAEMMEGYKTNQPMLLAGFSILVGILLIISFWV